MLAMLRGTTCGIQLPARLLSAEMLYLHKENYKVKMVIHLKRLL